MLDGLQAAESRLHARLRAEVADPDIPVETRLATGAVSQAVLEASTACGADLIVTGISRHDDIGDFLIGTTVERMIRHAHAPVLIVKEKTQHHYRRVLAVRRQNIWRRSRRRLAECCPRLVVDIKRRACGAASADIRWSVA
jgi:hypothetical protein